MPKKISGEKYPCQQMLLLFELLHKNDTSELILTQCVAAHCHLCAKRPWEMFSSLQSLDLLMPTGFFFHWPRLLSKYELRIVRVPFTVILNDAWLDRKFHFSCIVIVDIKFHNNYGWIVSGLINILRVHLGSAHFIIIVDIKFQNN